MPKKGYKVAIKDDGKLSRKGRKPYQPTADMRRAVEAMAAYGIPQGDIARVVQIAEKTLRVHFRDELDTSAIKANVKVAATLYEHAVGGNLTACMFWLKTRARWRETGPTEEYGDEAATNGRQLFEFKMIRHNADIEAEVAD